MQKTVSDIAVFLIVVSVLITMMVTFIIGILFAYRKRQQVFEKSLSQLRLDHEKTILSTQLEIQEQTFHHISREIHDNINLSLTLAKLNLNTISEKDENQLKSKIENSIELISNAIVELSNISKALNADLIIHQGLIKAVECELNRIKLASGFEVKYSLTGDPVYLNSQDELIVFRIIQEGFNNIIKHADASYASLSIDFGDSELLVMLLDNGKGFDLKSPRDEEKAGLKNMVIRTKTLGGTMRIDSEIDKGTKLSFSIPFRNSKN